jgi:hypothetical protein
MHKIYRRDGNVADFNPALLSPINDREKTSPGFDESLLEPERAPSLSLQDIFKNMIRQQAKQALGQAVAQPFQAMGIPAGAQAAQHFGESALPAIEQIPTGLKESVQRAYAGITGGEYHPSPVPEETGAGFGRGIGHLIGRSAIDIPAFAYGGPIGLGLAEAATTPGVGVDRLISGAEGAALPVAGRMVGAVAKTASKVPKQIIDLFRKTDTKRGLEVAHAKHDALEETANELFDWSKQQLKDRGVTSVKPSAELIEEIRPYIGTTHAAKETLKKAGEGDLEAIHAVQSRLWKRGTKAKTGDLMEFDKGEKMHELRDFLNLDVQNQLTSMGHLDAVHGYKQGQRLWSDLKSTYYDYPKIAKVFDPKLRKIPDDIAKHFGEVSTPMQRFLERHPELQSEIMGELAKRQAAKDLKRLGLTGISIGAAEQYGVGPTQLKKLLDLN